MFWIQSVPTAQPPAPCPSCGMTLRELSASGRVGCAGCYAHYREILRPYIRRLSNNSVHVGSIPGSAGAEISAKRRLQSLEGELKKAVAEQRFERCAELRDQIAALKGDGQR